MKQIREFYLLDEATGSAFRLDGSAGTYFSDVTGLGLDFSPAFTPLGGGFFAQTAPDTDEQQAIPGTITFTRDAYAAYRNFVSWITGAARPVLCYRPYGADTFRRRVFLRRLSKGELTRNRWLECAVSFDGLTPWYKPTAVRLIMESQTTGGKRYPYRYPYRYGSDSLGDYTAVIQPAGDLPAALTFRYAGAITSPLLTLRGLTSGKTWGELALPLTLTAADAVEWSSDPADSFLRKISGGAATDLTDLITPGSDPFFRMPAGEPCELHLTAAAAITGAAEATVRYFYRSV